MLANNIPFVQTNELFIVWHTDVHAQLKSLGVVQGEDLKEPMLPQNVFIKTIKKL